MQFTNQTKIMEQKQFKKCLDNVLSDTNGQIENLAKRFVKENAEIIKQFPDGYKYPKIIVFAIMRYIADYTIKERISDESIEEVNDFTSYF